MKTLPWGEGEAVDEDDEVPEAMWAMMDRVKGSQPAFEWDAAYNPEGRRQLENVFSWHQHDEDSFWMMSSPDSLEPSTPC
jgi:hypothetical protein